MRKQPRQKDTPWTILKVLGWTTSFFQSHAIESPRLDAELLLAASLKLGRIDLYLRHDQPLHPDELARFKSLIKRRVRREPVAYILGKKEFWSMDLRVNPAVLIPRPETECLVEQALKRLEARPEGALPPRILELGTGSGAVILALAAEQPAAICVATDRSPSALAVARENAAKHGLDRRVRFFAGDWFGALPRESSRFDLILSNPPYIPQEALSGLAPEIRAYEPRAALDGGPDGLAELGRILGAAPDYLAEDGWLLLEMGHDQGPAVERQAQQHPAYGPARFIPDYGGNPRVACLRKTGRAG